MLKRLASTPMIKAVPETSGMYLVTTDGRVISLKCHDGYIKELKHAPNADGYRHVSIRTSDGFSRTRLVHRLVANAFLPNPLNRPEVNHKNSDRTDNRVDNLEWVTHQENVAHAYSCGHKKPLKGSAHGRSILTEELVVSIRNRVANGETKASIAREFGMSRVVIGRAVSGKTWSHV